MISGKWWTDGIRTPDPLLAKPSTRLLVVKLHLPSCEDALKAFRLVLLREVNQGSCVPVGVP